MCQEKMFSSYTKTFGGKIWKNLHSVSPGNFLGKKFKMASLTIPAKNHLNITSCKKIESYNAHLSYSQKRIANRIFLTEH